MTKQLTPAEAAIYGLQTLVKMLGKTSEFDDKLYDDYRAGLLDGESHTLLVYPLIDEEDEKCTYP